MIDNSPLTEPLLVWVFPSLVLIALSWSTMAELCDAEAASAACGLVADPSPYPMLALSAATTTMTAMSCLLMCRASPFDSVLGRWKATPRAWSAIPGYPRNLVVVRFPASLLVASLLLVAAPALARAKPPTPELIERAEQGGQLGRSQADLYRAYALAAPERLPAAFRSAAPWDGTLTLLEVRRDLPTLRQAEREKIQALLAPQAQGPSCSNESSNQTSTHTTTHFHITYDGVDAGLTVAGYAASLEDSWQKEVDSFGWAAPPIFAANPAPGNRYHVRIDDLGPGLYGFVSPQGTYAGFVGNNPATAWDDADAYASCMVLNRDYSGFPSTPQASLDSTTAHEFNHSIQFGYGALAGANFPDDVFVEGGATWMEDEVHDAADDNRFYLWPVFRDSMGDYDNSPYPYWITFRGMTERYGAGSAGGAEQVMQDFWELTSQNAKSNQEAMAAALGVRGTTLADAFHAYAVAAKFNRPCAGGYAYPYCFEEGAGYVSIAGATAVHATVASVGASATTSVEDNHALAWVALPSSSAPYDVTLSNTSAGGQLRGTVACDTGSWPAAQRAALGRGQRAVELARGVQPGGLRGAGARRDQPVADRRQSHQLDFAVLHGQHCRRRRPRCTSSRSRRPAPVTAR